MLAAINNALLTRHLRGGRGRRVLLGFGRHRAVLDASGWVPTKHSVKAAQLQRQAHLGTFAALRLVHGARRAAELAEAARILVGRHWAALALLRAGSGCDVMWDIVSTGHGVEASLVVLSSLLRAQV